MTKKTVNVSIVAANFNNGRYLTDFIKSINDSSVLPKEFIIINDGSTDNSLQILNGFSYLEFIKVINFEQNHGFCEALNEGVKMASGKYILRVDPDDRVSEDRIKKQVDFLENNEHIDVIGSNAYYFEDNSSKILNASNFPLTHELIEQRYFNGEHGVMHGTITIRASVLKNYLYKQENFKAEDYDIFARMIKNGHRFVNLNEPLTHVRIHAKSISNQIEYSTIKLTFRLRDEIFGTHTSSFWTRIYYWHILNYRKYLITKNLILKAIYLAFAIGLFPMKVLNRIFRF